MPYRLIVPLVLGIALGARPAAAQTTYARSAKDTLRYHEVTHTEVNMSTPQGSVSVPMEHDATIAVLLLPGDSARAWYESLRLSVTAPRGVMTPETGPALRQPFALNMDARGRTRLLSAPTFPESFQGITDLTHQFDDFFLRLPAEPLKVGLTWTDTVTRADSSADKRLRSTTIAEYRVERDTTVGGQAGLLVNVRQHGTVNTEAAMHGQNARLQTQMTGTDSGWFVFAPKSGRMLARQRKGEFRGETLMTAPSGSMTVQQSMTYTHSINLK